MNIIIGRFVYYLLRLRYRTVKKKVCNFESIQQDTLHRIINKNKNKKYLTQYSVENTSSFDKLPIVEYRDLEPYILDIVYHSQNDLTSSEIIAMSQSSGTTSSRKWIPQSKQNIYYNYLAGLDLLSIYIQNCQDTKILNGQNFSLTGTCSQVGQLVIGDISALLAYYLPWFFKPFRVPKLKDALEPKWPIKLNRWSSILSESDVRWVAGVPSWVNIVISKAKELCDSKKRKLWPEFEVFFYGGTALGAFRDRIQELFDHSIRFWQCYNASEGYFASQWQLTDSSMALMPHYGIYYEFIDSNTQSVVSYRDLELMKIYELVITNECGLWRYRIGDLIQIKGLNPLTIEVVGRNSQYINAFGEELMLYHCTEAIAKIANKHTFKLYEYTVAPEINENDEKYHVWLMAFELLPDNISQYESDLDQLICELNHDYASKRSNDILMKQLKIKLVSPQKIDDWMAKYRSYTPQAKLPKLTHNMEIIEQILLD